MDSSSMHYTCNSLKCRTVLSSGYSWVTFCSHIFCDDCGSHMSHSYVCLACEVSLCPTGMAGVSRLWRINIEPSNEEKRISLAGHNPGTIMEMCMAGLSFNQRQIKLEINIIQEKIKRMKDREEKLKDYYEQVILQYKVKLTKTEMELEEVKKFNMEKNQEVMSSSSLATGESSSCQAYRSQQEAVSRQQSNYHQQQPNYSQKSSNYFQQPSYYSKEPSNYSQKPSNYFQQPSYYSQEPSNYRRQQSNYSQKPSNYRQQPSNYVEYSGVPQKTDFTISRYNKDSKTIPVSDSSISSYSRGNHSQPKTSSLW